MRVRIDRNPAKGSGLNFTEGQIADVDDGVGQLLISMRLATVIDTEGIEPIRAVPMRAALTTAPAADAQDIKADDSGEPAGIVFASDESSPASQDPGQQPQTRRRK